MAKEFLSRQGIPYVEKDVSRDRLAAQEMVARSGQNGVPVIEIDGQMVVGFDQPRLEQLLAQTGGGRVALGAAVADAARILARHGGIPVFGAHVGRVSPGSAAERAGLAVGDIITELNLRPIHNADDVEKALAGLRPGSRASLVFTRGNNTYRAELSFQGGTHA